MRRRLKAGTTIADSADAALAGDVVAPGLCANPNNRLIPLDAGAVAQMQATGFPNAQVGVALTGPPNGGDGIDV
jgi:hypothetical protein